MQINVFLKSSFVSLTNYLVKNVHFAQLFDDVFFASLQIFFLFYCLYGLVYELIIHRDKTQKVNNHRKMIWILEAIEKVKL